MKFVTSLLLIASIFFNILPLRVQAQKAEEAKTKGLTVSLRAGKRAGSTLENKSAATISDISDQRADEILGGLKPIEIPRPSDFKLPPDSIKPPKTLVTRRSEITPNVENIDTPNERYKNEPLHILRYSPTGNDQIPGEISITFSQPMTALDAAAEMDKSAKDLTSRLNDCGY